jgi:hypothetical protein
MDKLLENKLEFYLPVEIDLEKSIDSGGDRIIRGYASNNSRDRQNEEIVQKGLDISEFINHGWFNYDHDNTKILGYPIKENTGIDSRGFFVEGYLLKGVPLADSIWNLAVALKKSNAPRKLGFSVEGRVLEKSNSGRVLSAKVFNVAITPNPVNPTATWEAIVKSFCGGNDIVSDTVPGMTAGYGFDMNENSQGAVLKPESLEGSLKNLSYLLREDDDYPVRIKMLQDYLNSKSLTREEVALYLQIVKGLSRKEALYVYDTAYNQ